MPVNRIGLILMVLVSGALSQAQNTVPDKEASYTALVSNPENGPLVDAVLDAWLDKEGFDALRQHLETRQEVAQLTSQEHATLALLWRRLGTSTRALEHWEKATSADPKNSRLWLERAGQEARLQRFPQALASLGNIIDPADTGDARDAAVLLANLSRQTGENSARQMLHKWMEARPDDVELWLDLADMMGRFSGSEKQWQDRLQGWQETVADPALLSRIQLMVCDELSNQGKPQEALTQAIEALTATPAGSKPEKLLQPMLVALYRRSFNSSPALKPGPLELAETNMDRPDLALALAAVVGEQGDIQESLKLLGALSEKHPKHAGLIRVRLAGMEDLRLYDEAATVLQTQQADDSVSLALLYRDAGLQEKALAAIEKLPDTDFTRVVRAVISGEKPALAPMAKMAPTEEVSPPEPPAWQAGLEALALPEKTARLFDLWSAEPLNEGIAKALITNWSQAGKTTEAEHVCMSVFNRLLTPQAQRRWCQSLAGSSSNFNLNRTLLKQGANLRETAGYWLGLASVGDGSGMEQQAGALLAAAERMQGDEALLLRFQAAEALLAQRQIVPAAEVAGGLLGTAQDAAARLLLARIDLLEGRVNQARRVLWSLAADEAMTPNQAGALSSGLLRWHEKADADAFLALQRRRFPDEPPLLMLQLFSLRQTENNEERIQSLLDMGMVRLKEPPQRSIRINTPEGKLSPEDTARADWWALQSALSNEDHFQHENLEYFAAAGLSDRRYSYLWSQSTSGHLRSWAMAQLLRHAEDERLDPSARKGLSMRAQKAGLPLPEVLVWARLETAENGTERIVPNLDLLEALPVEDWLMPVAGHFHQRLARQSGDMRPLTAQENRVLEKLTLALRKNASPQSLTLSFQWWRALPDSAEAKAAITAEFDPKGRLPETLPQTLVTLLAELTPEQRRDAALASVPPALAAWLSANEGSSTYFGADGFAAAQCYLLLGRWQEAAKWAERSWLLPGAPGAPTPAPPQQSRLTPAWLFPQSQPAFSWPPSDALLGLLIPTQFLSAQSGQSLSSAQPLIKESERNAFLSAAENLTHKPLRLLWLLKGEDPAAAKALVRAWLKEKPEDPVALRLTACLEAAEGRRDEALDILHSMISTRPAGSSEHRLAQSLYLRSALLAGGPGPQFRNANAHVQPPPPKHLERVRQTLLELLPEIENWPDSKGHWLPAYKAAGLADAVASWERPANLSMPTEETGDWSTGPFVRDSSRRRLLEEAYQPRRISSYEVTLLLEAGKQDQAFTLMLLGLREEADQHFLRRSNGGSDWAQPLQNPEHKARLLQLAQTLPRRSPRELNHALHVAEICGDWRQLVDWAVAGGSLLDSNPYLQSRLDLAKLELGESVAELAGKLTESPVTQRRERFRYLMSALASSRSFPQRLRLAELFVLMAEAPSAESMLKESDRSSITQSVFHALTSTFVLPHNVGSVPPLYPELVTGSPEKQPSPPPPDITPADLDKRRQLHSRLCDLALKSDAWLRHSLTHVMQRHLMENQPSEELLMTRIKKLQSSPMGGSYMADQLAQSGQSWRDMTPRLKLARLLMKVIQSTETLPAPEGWNQPQRNRLDSLMTLIGAEVPAASFPPLWALWEFPHDSPQIKHPHTAQQIEWNRERQKLFEELCEWALEQPRDRTSVFPKWAGYRLHFPDTDALVLKHARELKEEPGDPYSLRSFVQTAMLSYSNGHHVRSAEIVLTLLKESGPDKLDATVAPSVLQLLLKGRDNQALAMPPLSLPPEETDPAQHDLTPGEQRRRLILVEELSQLLSTGAGLPADLLLAKLEKAAAGDANLDEITRGLIENAKSNPEVYGSKISSFLHSGRRAWAFRTESRVHAALVPLAEAWTQPPFDQGGSSEWLVSMMRFLLESGSTSNGHKALPASLKGAADMPDEIKDPIVRLRDQTFDRLLSVLVRFPQHRAFYLPLRCQKELPDRARWPSLIEELVLQMRAESSSAQDFLSQWLPSESLVLDNDRVILLRDFILELLPVYDREVGADEGAWLTTIGHTILNHDMYHTDRPSTSLVARDLLFLASGGIYGKIYPGDPDQAEADFQRAAYVQILRAAAELPVFLSESFKLLLPVLLDTEAEYLGRMASKLPRTELTNKMRPILRHLEDTQSSQPLGRKIALVSLLLEVSGGLKFDGWSIDEYTKKKPSISPEKLIQYLNHETLPSGPSKDFSTLLERRDSLIRKLRALADQSPKFNVAQRVSALFSSLMQREPSPGDVDLLISLHQENPEGLTVAFQQLTELLKAPAGHPQIGFDSQRYRIAMLLTRTLETLPARSNFMPVVSLSDIGSLLTQPNLGVARSRQGRLLIERLMDLAVKAPDSGASFMNFYMHHQTLTEEGRAHALRRLLQRAALSPTGITEMLKPLNLKTRRSGYQQNLESYLGILRLHRELLEHAPTAVGPEANDWVRCGIEYAANARAPSPYYPMLTFAGADIVPEPPHDPACQLLVEEIHSLAEARKALTPEWLVPTRLRFLSRRHDSVEARAAALRPLFTSANMSIITSYLGQVLDSPEQQKSSRGYLEMSQDSPRDLMIWEVYDALRCLAAAAGGKLIPPDVLKPFHVRAREIMLQLTPKVKRTGNQYQRSYIQEPPPLQLAMDEFTMALQAQQADELPDIGRLEAYLLNAARQKVPLSQVVDSVRALIMKDPIAVDAVLDTWVRSMNAADKPKLDLLMASLVTCLAEIWTAEELPEPQWVAAFCKLWSSRFLVSSQGEDILVLSDLTTRLAAVLERFPQITDPSYFTLLCRFTGHIGPPQIPRLRDLAEQHLTAVLNSGLTPNLTPTLAYIPRRSELRAVPFLVEDAWRSGLSGWANPDLRSLFDSKLRIADQRALAAFEGLYFSSPTEFLTQAKAWMRANPPISEGTMQKSASVEVLRVARLRQIMLNWEDWRQILPPAELQNIKSSFLQSRDLVPWIQYQMEQGQQSISTPLTDYFREALNNTPFLSPDDMPTAKGDRLREPRNSVDIMDPFTIPLWNWIWNSVYELAIADSSWLEALITADDLGFMRDSDQAALLIHASALRGYKTLPMIEAQWWPWIESTQLLKDHAEIRPLWLMTTKGKAPIWMMADRLSLADVASVLERLHRLQETQPGLGRALLRLSLLGRQSRLSAQEIETELAAVTAPLAALSERAKVSLLEALQLKCPSLRKIMDDASEHPVWRSLKVPAEAWEQPPLVQFWTLLKREDLAGVLMHEETLVDRLENDLFALLVEGYPGTEDFLSQTAQRLHQLNPSFTPDKILGSVLLRILKRLSIYPTNQINNTIFEGRQRMILATLRLMSALWPDDVLGWEAKSDYPSSRKLYSAIINNRSDWMFDGKGISQDLLDVATTGRPGSCLAFVDDYSSLIGMLPTGTCLDLLAALEEKAVESPANELLCWAVACAWHDHKVEVTRSPLIDERPPPPIALSTLWNSPDTPLLVKFWIHQAAPALTAGLDPVAIVDLSAAVLTAAAGREWLNFASKLDLRPINQTPLTPALRQSLRALSSSLLHLDSIGAASRSLRSASSLELRFNTNVVIPLLDLLHSAKEAASLTVCLRHFAAGNLLFAGQVLDQAIGNPNEAHVWLSSYQSKASLSWVLPPADPLPPVTADTFKVVNRLMETKTHPNLEALKLLLVAGPDDENRPPAISREQRLLSWAYSRPSVAQAVVSHIPLIELLQLPVLPVIGSLPDVKAFFAIGDYTPIGAETRPSALPAWSAFAALSWVKHDNTQPILQLAKWLTKPSHSLAARVSLSSHLQEILFVVLAYRLENAGPIGRLKDARFIEEILPMLHEARNRREMLLFSTAARLDAPNDPIWDRLDDVLLTSQEPYSYSFVNQPRSLPLWSAAAKSSSMDIPTRLRILLKIPVTSSSQLTFKVTIQELQKAVTTGLLTPANLADSVHSLPSAELLSALPVLVGWLHMAGQHEAAKHLLEKTAADAFDPSLSTAAVTWAWLADHCRHLEQTELRSLFTERAEAAHTLHASENARVILNLSVSNPTPSR